MRKITLHQLFSAFLKMSAFWFGHWLGIPGPHPSHPVEWHANTFSSSHVLHLFGNQKQQAFGKLHINLSSTSEGSPRPAKHNHYYVNNLVHGLYKIYYIKSRSVSWAQPYFLTSKWRNERKDLHKSIRKYQSFFDVTMQLYLVSIAIYIEQNTQTHLSAWVELWSPLY